LERPRPRGLRKRGGQFQLGMTGRAGARGGLTHYKQVRGLDTPVGSRYCPELIERGDGHTLQPQNSSFVIRNDLAELSSLAGQLEGFLELQDAAPNTVYAVNMAVEEMVSNIIKYGYDDAGPHEIAVRVACEPNVVTVTLEDDGHEFDPLSRTAPDVDLPVEERQIGGLGIFLVRKLCADMQYHRVDGRNVLTLLFRGGAGVLLAGDSEK